MNKEKRRTGDVFGQHAKLYAMARPTYPREIFDHIVKLCKKKATAWDCATGTGQAAASLSQYFRKVYATDINTNQIEEASQARNIMYSVASAEDSGFAKESFDLITVAQALHWFDFQSFWLEVDRVLKPNGVFAAWGYDWTKINFEVDFQIGKNLFEPLSDYWNPRAEILWQGYNVQQVRFPYKKVEMPKFTIDLYWNLDQLFQYFLSWSATQAFIKDNGEDRVVFAKQEVQKIWGDPKSTKLIQWPVHMLVGIKE